MNNVRRKICRGCKFSEQDCMMIMTEREGRVVHGLTTMERVNIHHGFGMNPPGAGNLKHGRS